MKKNSKSCSMVGNNFVVEVFQIVSTVLCSISVGEFNFQFNLRSFASAFIKLSCWLFNGPQPWLYSHELITFIIVLFKITGLFFDDSNMFGLLLFSWNTNELNLFIIAFFVFVLILISPFVLFATLLIFLFTFFYNFLSALNFP